METTSEFKPVLPQHLPETRQPGPGDCMISFLCVKGDTKVVWNPNDASETENAKRQFEYLVKEKGFVAFKTDDKGDKGEQIRAFDPKVSRMILCPPVRGGI